MFLLWCCSGWCQYPCYDLAVGDVNVLVMMLYVGDVNVLVRACCIFVVVRVSCCCICCCCFWYFHRYCLCCFVGGTLNLFLQVTHGFGAAKHFMPLPHTVVSSIIFLVRVKSKISTKLQVGAHCTWQLRLNTVPARIPGENIVNFYSRHQPTNCNIIKVCSTIVLVDRMILLQLFSETITEVICHSAGERCGGSMYYSCKQVRY